MGKRECNQGVLASKFGLLRCGSRLCSVEWKPPFSSTHLTPFLCAGICSTFEGISTIIIPLPLAMPKTTGQAVAICFFSNLPQSHILVPPSHLVRGREGIIIFVDGYQVFPSLWLSISIRLSNGLSVPLVSLTFHLYFLLDDILIT